MAKFHGNVGYGRSVQDPPDSGVWVNQITEFPYYGDVIRDIRRLEDGESLNENIAVNNAISIVADKYAIDNFMFIKYVNWAGTNWLVTAVEVKSPRLILNLGSVYNGPTS